MVSSGSRSDVVDILLNCGSIRALKLLKILTGMSFRTKISCPDLPRKNLSRQNARQMCGELPTKLSKRDQYVVAPGEYS